MVRRHPLILLWRRGASPDEHYAIDPEVCWWENFKPDRLMVSNGCDEDSLLCRRMLLGRGILLQEGEGSGFNKGRLHGRA
ncbi:MAG: hypothetical protein FGF53_00920 [Candidatus Brockarchaeota archaeon]|nr:hypothetical protein [Candidatus Brockarchaeota archaeon]MBO3808484.1 hypothetical protein [Candidatus Brockarchaeota archaeon]